MQLLVILISRWSITFIGAAILAGLIWLFGPLLPQAEDAQIRFALIVATLLIWAGVNLLLDAQRKHRDLVLTEGATESVVSSTPVSAVNEEAEALRNRLRTALRSFKQTLRTRGYLYELPWYVIIGPPGAGKTTALLNAGLKFPLATEMGEGAVAGVGGTRLCDWWFTEDAVLIDTAGRYTTQDSDASVDRAGWEAFLDLLKRTRPREPLNGVIVAFPLSDIALAPAAKRLAHAGAIRRRIKELEARLLVRVPVYAVFTKTDLIAGFTEFFDDLDREARAQVWGTTFPLSGGEGESIATFAKEFHALVERLNLRLFDRLHLERNLTRRSLIAMFPGQIASLEQPLLGFLQRAFGGSQSDPAPLLRGVYLTSGTQEGTPIDRLNRTLSQTFGVDQADAPSLRPKHGRSYFLERLLREVVFGEAMLVSRKPGATRRYFAWRVAGVAVSLLVLLALGARLWHIQAATEHQISDVSSALNSYEQTAQGMPLEPVADADLLRLAPLLDQARALPYGIDEAAASTPSWRNLWLSQHDKLAAASRAVYRHALEWALLPRLIWRLEAQLRGNLKRPEFLYEATRVYLMLGSAGPLDRALVHEWMRLDWQLAFPGVALAPARASLLGHLDALLAEPLPQVPLDGELVVQARSAFATVSMAQRIYSRIRPSAAAQRLPAWRPSDALGAAGAGLFVRSSGKPISDGIPGFFTVNGFHTVLLPSLADTVKDVVAESWVLGRRIELDAKGPQARALEHEVIAEYEADYAQAWDALLADLNIVQQRSVSQAAQDLYILLSPQSPMRSLLASITRQLSLSIPPSGIQSASPRQIPTAEPRDDSVAMRLQSVLGTSPQGEPVALRPGHEIDERYRSLIDLMGNGPAAPIDLVLRSLSDMQQQLAKMAATLVSSGSIAAPSGIDPALALKSQAVRQPQPLARWLTAIADGGSALRSGNPRQQLVAMFNASGGPAEMCRLAANGHYPFSVAATQDTSLGYFSRLFAPGGLFDGFVNTLLRPYVDTSSRTWHLQTVNGVTPPISPGDLVQFQRAAAIRDAFFADGGSAAFLRLDITPLELDAGASEVALDLDGATVRYSHGPARATQITWPGPDQTQSARLIFAPPPTGRADLEEEVGAWSIFRLFAQGRLQQSRTPGGYDLTFQVGERRAVFEIRAASTTNPFTPTLLQDFRCPVVK
jgi:type VI secretion system protein ImpL